MSIQQTTCAQGKVFYDPEWPNKDWYCGIVINHAREVSHFLTNKRQGYSLANAKPMRQFEAALDDGATVLFTPADRARPDMSPRLVDFLEDWVMHEAPEEIPVITEKDIVEPGIRMVIEEMRKDPPKDEAEKQARKNELHQKVKTGIDQKFAPLYAQLNAGLFASMPTGLRDTLIKYEQSMRPSQAEGKGKAK